MMINNMLPGPLGNLGICALCGDTFLAEILLCGSVQPFKIAGCDQTFYAHDRCFMKYQGVLPENLPEASPIREALEKNGN